MFTFILQDFKHYLKFLIICVLSFKASDFFLWSNVEALNQIEWRHSNLLHSYSDIYILFQKNKRCSHANICKTNKKMCEHIYQKLKLHFITSCSHDPKTVNTKQLGYL